MKFSGGYTGIIRWLVSLSVGRVCLAVCLFGKICVLKLLHSFQLI